MSTTFSETRIAYTAHNGFDGLQAFEQYENVLLHAFLIVSSAYLPHDFHRPCCGW